MTYFIADDESALLLLPRVHEDVGFSYFPAMGKGQFLDRDFNLVPHWRESSVPALFHMTALSLGNGLRPDRDTLAACKAAIPRNTPASIDRFDYLPTLTTVLENDTLRFTFDPASATEWRDERTKLSVSFSEQAKNSAKTAPPLYGVGELADPEYLYALALSMHICAYISENISPIRMPDFVADILKEKQSVLAALPEIARKLGLEGGP
jgi:hypothetical protein